MWRDQETLRRKTGKTLKTESERIYTKIMNTGDFVAYSHGPREGCLKGCRMRGATLEHPCLWGELGMEKRVFLGDRQ